jgi:periplasmic divalent cation tolerance protein
VILVYVTFPNLREAKKICRILLREKLIACTNIFKSNSLFEWQGKLNDINEYVAIMKTTEKHKENLEKRIKELHSYTIPAIIFFEVNASKEFEKWVKESTI